MTKIVIDARESGTSTGRYVDKLIENLAKLKPGFKIIVLTKPHRVDFLKEVAPDFEVFAADIKEFTFAEQFRLLRHLWHLKPDLVHFSMTQQPVLYRRKKITTIHDLTTIRFHNPSKNWFVFRFKQIVYKWVIKSVARKSKLIIAPSDYVRRDVASFARVDPAKIIVTHEAADKITEPAKPVAGLKPGNFLMYVGRPNPHKNLDRLIEAFKLLQGTHPNLKLVLVGQKDKLYAQIEQRNITGVKVAGFMSEGQLLWLYENCAAYIFPSLSEGFGLPALEAMAHGAPVASSNATCLPEVYGSAAHYFDPLDVADMAAKIAEVLDDKTLRSKLIESGKKQARKYSWAKMAEQTLEIYERALKN